MMKLHSKVPIALLVFITISSIAADAPSRNQRENIVQLNIFVEIDGVVSASFESVEGLESTTEAVEFSEGIWAKSVRKLPGRTSYSNIVLKRPYTFNAELWKWRKKVVDGNVERKSGTITVTGRNREETVRFKFHDAWPVRWRLSIPDDRSDKCLIEELEITIEKLELLLVRQ